jgi:sugar phosphate permease
MAFSNWANNAFNELSPGFMAIDKPIGLGLGASTAGKLSSGTWVGMIIGMFCAGIIIDRIFKGRSAPIVIIGFICNLILYNGILFPAIHSSTSTLSIWLMASGFVNPFTAIGNQCFAIRTFPPNVIGKVIALWTCASNFMGSFGVMAGSLALDNTGTYHMSFIFISLASVVGLIAAIVSREKRTAIEEMFL